MEDEAPTGDAAPDAVAPAEPSFSEAFAAAARSSALGHLKPGETPTAGALLGAMGGIRGLIESILPGVVFLIVYTVANGHVRSSLLIPISVGAPILVSLGFIVARLVQRQSVTTAMAGLFGILISAILALVTGKASNNFLLGFGIDAALALIMLISLAVRRPLIGVVIGLLAGDPEGWRADRAKRRVAWITTILWAAFPLLRLIVQVPLYLANLTTALGATKLIMGVPLYAGVVWVTWLLARAVLTPRPAEGV